MAAACPADPRAPRLPRGSPRDQAHSAAPWPPWPPPRGVARGSGKSISVKMKEFVPRASAAAIVWRGACSAVAPSPPRPAPCWPHGLPQPRPCPVPRWWAVVGGSPALVSWGCLKTAARSGGGRRGAHINTLGPQLGRGAPRTPPSAPGTTPPPPRRPRHTHDAHTAHTH